MIGIVSSSKILVANPLRLPGIEDAFAVVVLRLFRIGIVNAQRIRIAQPFPPGIHQRLHSLDIRLVSWIGGQVGQFVRVGRKISVNLQFRWFDNPDKGHHGEEALL